MTFSIITATFNSSAVLQGLIEKVLSEEAVKLEHIIVDGGSTDGTVDIIKKYASCDSRLRWISEPDEGIADAFNKGVKMATGDWIGFIGSDDRYLPGALEDVAKVIQKRPDAGVIHGDMVRLDEAGTPLYIVKPSDVERTIWRQMPINHPASFVSRKALEKIGFFDKDLKIAMDYDLILRLFKSGEKFVYIDKPIVEMSYGGASDTKCLDGLKEVRVVKIREGFPQWKADYWLVYRYLVETIKRGLRKAGLRFVLKLHPRFKDIDS